MPSYKAPVRDMRFVLHEVFGTGFFAETEALSDFTPDLIDPILTEAAKLCETVLFPLNRSGDEEGCTLARGQVTTPTGFKEAYKLYCDGGWPAMGCKPEFGGQGVPKTVVALVEEMVAAANLGFSAYPGLSYAGAVALEAHGSDALKAAYLPAIVDGRWTATMCLTEPQCGTDLSLIRTRAVPVADGYHITGTKIFISAGEHDLAENIIHLVLARLPDALPGIKGISLFLVPKFLPDGSRNAVECGAIEHKMGMKGSATCTMNFDNAQGWLVGQLHKGMAAMFAMMNKARLSVGLQGLGLADISHQNALAYARDRLQGRALPGLQGDGSADPIIRHLDVKRMLLTQKAWIEGMRALAVWIALALDRRDHAASAADRAAAEDFVALMTPISKALFTDLGSECTHLGVQIFGGHGYIREHGMEQYVRDCRITQLYEGTNGVQALDLVLRKVPEGDGRLLATFCQPVEALMAALSAVDWAAETLPAFRSAYEQWQQATRFITSAPMADRMAVASDYLRLFGLVALGHVWLRMMQVAAVGGEDFHRAKMATGRFYLLRLLTQADGLSRAILTGGPAVSQFDEALFG